MFLTWLTLAPLACMHASEGVGSRYDDVELDRVALEVDGVGTIDAAGAYVSRNGALVDGAGPVRLAAVPARGCALPVSTQPLMQRAADARLAPTWLYRRFMGRILRSLRYHAQASTVLARSAIPRMTADTPYPAVYSEHLPGGVVRRIGEIRSSGEPPVVVRSRYRHSFGPKIAECRCPIGDRPCRASFPLPYGCGGPDLE